MGLSDLVSANLYAPAPLPVVTDHSRRNNERLYEADMLTVRAVVGPPQQRCWVEREQVPQEGSNKNVPDQARPFSYY